MVHDELSYHVDLAFKCPNCEKRIELRVAVPKAALRSDTIDKYTDFAEINVSCEHCKAFHSIEAKRSAGRVFARLAGEPTIGVDCEHYMSAEEEELFEGFSVWAGSPADSLVEAQWDIDEVLQLPDAIMYFRVLARMAFIQQFAALEAYLADKLIGKVKEDSEARLIAVSAIEGLKSVEVSLKEVAKDPDIVSNRIIGFLQTRSYHDFEKVENIWKPIFRSELFPNTELRRRMIEYTSIRHDCVHRNGRGHDMKPRREVDFEFVERVGLDIGALLDHIEDSFEDELDFGL